MAVKIRLARAGAKKTPFYRIVAADSRSPRDGRFIEILGRYNPRTEPSTIQMDVEKVEAWVAKGAQMSDRVATLLAIAKNPEAQAPEAGTKPSKKARAKVAAEAEAASKAAEAPAEASAEEPVAEESAESEPVAIDEPPAEEAVAEDVAEETAGDDTPTEE